MWGKKLFALFILLFLAVFGIFAWVFQPERISQEVLDLFPQNESKLVIEAHRYFASSKYVPIAIKGFDEEAHKIAIEVEKRLMAMPHIISVSKNEPSLYVSFYDFLTHNDAYLLAPKGQNVDSEPAVFEPLLSKLAPSLGHLPVAEPLRAGDYGLMLLAELENLEDSTLQSTLSEFKALQKDYPTLHYFSPDFMGVENLHLILQEVNFLLGFASLVFIIIYFVIIRIPFLTFSTILTLIFSNTIAILLTLLVYPKVTIMALSFGMGISNIAIDYMMHHHFFGLYTHSRAYANANSPRPAFNRPVFYGYLTTMIGFGVCLFIPFPLLAQLSLYAMISLSISYISFAFIYPRIGFNPPRLFHTLSQIKKPLVPNIIFLILACIGFAFALSTLKLDFDLSKLDYQNQAMLEERAFFENLTPKDELQVLIIAQEKEGLLLFVRGLAKDLGWLRFYRKEGDSQLPQYYYLLSLSQEQLTQANTLLESIAHKQAPTNLWNTKELESIAKAHISLESRSLQKTMDSLADAIYQPMLIVLILALCLMLLSLALSVGKAFFNALNFVLFPLSMALCVVSSHSVFNMMHLFALLILIVVSVDYGIYAIKETEDSRATHAILFSALTTGISFGILTLSQTKALNSFGEVIFTGMSCMTILLIFGRFRQKGVKNDRISTSHSIKDLQ
ncbi:MAG: hypothetical protein J1E28_01495 [Helicobacter sp.]|uniref:hypothetical protein n=1 Tax=Helicobacter sp. TaxID=218 RepID=UPI0025C59C67|nr:hypothetical protein [Helicobacter sp.]MCH5313061.1 hypothetical protein [Helicobacter sp.]